MKERDIEYKSVYEECVRRGCVNGGVKVRNGV